MDRSQWVELVFLTALHKVWEELETTQKKVQQQHEKVTAFKDQLSG